MIKFTKTEVPASLKHNSIQIHLNSLRNLLRTRKLNSKDFKSSVWLKDDVRKTLSESQFKKCCYCEKQLELKREVDVDHFRPKTKVTENAEHPGYWWLAYDWDNYLYSCKQCNSDHKINHFPVANEENRISVEGENTDEEQALLINPYFEDPSNFLAYDYQDREDIPEGVWVTARGDDAQMRGKHTADICGLNRSDLITRRARVLKTLILALRSYDVAMESENQTKIKRAKQTLKLLLDPYDTFLGMKKYFFEQMHYNDLLTELINE